MGLLQPHVFVLQDTTRTQIPQTALVIIDTLLLLID